MLLCPWAPEAGGACEHLFQLNLNYYQASARDAELQINTGECCRTSLDAGDG